MLAENFELVLGLTSYSRDDAADSVEEAELQSESEPAPHRQTSADQRTAAPDSTREAEQIEKLTAKIKEMGEARACMHASR